MIHHKLVIPTIGQAVAMSKSSELTTLLASHRVVVVAAQAGWGKTTAVASWAVQMPRVAWYTLDQSDRDPRIFLEYVCTCLLPFVPALQAILDDLPFISLHRLYIDTAQQVVNATIDVTIILDDFHLIEERDNAPADTILIFDLLATLTQYGNHRLVVVSRATPAIHGLARLAVHGKAFLADYTWLECQQETVLALAQQQHVSLSSEQAQGIAQQCGGWITGILLSLRTKNRTMSTTPSVYTFIVEQIIAPLPADLQDFLVETSVLNELSAALCNQLRDREDSAFFLEDIQRRGLFVAERGGWLSYHSLFREFLRSRLSREPSRERTLLLRAGEMYRDTHVEYAFHCFLEADAPEQASMLLQQAGTRMGQEGQHRTLIALIDRLAKIYPIASSLLLIKAKAYIALALWHNATPILHTVVVMGTPQESIVAQLMLADMALLQNNYAEAQQMLSHITKIDLDPDLFLAYLLTAGRTAFYSHDPHTAIDLFTQAQVVAQNAALYIHDPVTMAQIQDNLGWAHMELHNNRQALIHLQRADAYWQSTNNHGRRALTLNNLGNIAMKERRLGEAAQAFATGIELAQQAGRRRNEVVLRYSFAELLLLRSELQAAQDQCASTFQLAGALHIAEYMVESATLAAWIALLRQDTTLTIHWLDQTTALELEMFPGASQRSVLIQALLKSSKGVYAPDAWNDLSVAEQAAWHLVLARDVLPDWGNAEPHWLAFVELSSRVPETQCVALMEYVADVCEAATSHGHDLPWANHLTEHWTITALGTCTLKRRHHVIDLTPRHQAVLIRLLEAGQAGVSMEQLLQDVWDNRDVSAAAVHQAMRRLRNQTSLECVTQDGVCGIRSEWSAIHYDVAVFEKALDRCDIEEAMRMYQPFFLNAPLQAVVWADQRREYLKRRYATLLEYTARRTANDGERLRLYLALLDVIDVDEDIEKDIRRIATDMHRQDVLTRLNKRRQRVLL